MDLYTILIIGHIIGTVLGAGGALVAEVQIRKALADGEVSQDERALMHGNYFLIRVGLALIIISGLALVWWNLSQGNNWVLTSAKLYVKDIMVLAIIVNAVLLTKRMMPLWLGSAISFVSWWGALVLGAWRTPYSFTVLLVAYVIITLVLAVIFKLWPPGKRT